MESMRVMGDKYDNEMNKLPLVESNINEDIYTNRGEKRAVLNRVLSAYAPASLLLVLGSLFLIISAAAQMGIPYFVGEMFDALIDDDDEYKRPIEYVAVLFIVATFFGCMRRMCFSLAGHRMTRRVRCELFKNILKQTMKFFDENSAAEIDARLTLDVATLQEITDVYVKFVGLLIQFVAGIAFITYLAWKLTVIMALLYFVSFIALIVYFFMYSKRSLESVERATNISSQAISKIRTVKSFSKEPHEFGKFQEEVNNAFKQARLATFVSTLFDIVTGFIGSLSVALLLWFGVDLVNDGDNTVGELVAALLYIVCVAYVMTSMSTVTTHYHSVLEAWKRVFEILANDNKEPVMKRSVSRLNLSSLAGGGVMSSINSGSSGDDVTMMPEFRGNIHFDNITFSHWLQPDVNILNGFSLTCLSGKKVAILSTRDDGAVRFAISSLLQKFYTPDSGLITSDGEDLTEIDPTFFREKLGFVTSDSVILEGTVAYNISYAKTNHVSIDSLIEAAKIANAHDFITNLPQGYDTVIGDHGLALLPEQIQGIVIARAVLRDPAVLVIDESITSSITFSDPQNKLLIENALDELMRRRTVIAFARRLKTMQNADRVVVLDNGSVVLQGTHRELLAQSSPLYSELVRKLI